MHDTSIAGFHSFLNYRHLTKAYKGSTHVYNLIVVAGHVGDKGKIAEDDVDWGDRYRDGEDQGQLAPVRIDQL